MAELRFLSNEANEGEGLSDAGIEFYRADPFPAVARETSQNSRDAHDKKEFPGTPVRLEIDKIRVPSSTLPGYDKFKLAAEHCLEAAIRLNQAKEVQFFKQALKILAATEIAVLRIADYHTKGLRGPCEEGHPFHSLVKSSGVSNKDDDTSGGSFGIGKSAVYSASDLQTVFYSTAYPDAVGATTFLCQGKTKFRSFTDAHAKPFRSIGYWGKSSGYMPVDDVATAPEWLRRQKTGTTVCSIAVRESADWQNEIIASLLTNFFSAIHKGEMEFCVDGKEINRNTLRIRFDDQSIRVVARAKQEDYDFAVSMYDCLTNANDPVEHQIEIPGAGEFRLRLMVRDGLPKRVGILRNGMFICDSLVHFGDKFSRFPMYRDFVAIVEPANDAGNAWLRRLENPRHDEFSPERLLTEADRAAARAAGHQLASRIRSVIKDAAKPTSEEETDLDELSEFFAIEDHAKPDEQGTRNIETVKVKKPPVRPRVRQTRPPLKPGDGVAGGGGIDIGGGGGGNGPGLGPFPGNGGGGTGKNAARRPFALLEPRTLMPDRKDPFRREIRFTPKASGKAFLEFESSGINETTALPLASGLCGVDCVEGQRQSVEVRFSIPYDGPVEVSAWTTEEGQR